jgi:hypothetical protein
MTLTRTVNDSLGPSQQTTTQTPKRQSTHSLRKLATLTFRRTLSCTSAHLQPQTANPALCLCILRCRHLHAHSAHCCKVSAATTLAPAATPSSCTIGGRGPAHCQPHPQHYGHQARQRRTAAAGRIRKCIFRSAPCALQEPSLIPYTAAAATCLSTPGSTVSLACQHTTAAAHAAAVCQQASLCLPFASWFLQARIYLQTSLSLHHFTRI